MSEKSLKNKAIKIKGKDYVLVSDRVTYFNETYPDGAITTDLVSEPTSDYIIVKATVYPEYGVGNKRHFTGYSQAVIGDGMVNKTAALENAETSAVGRALGFMGIGVIESIASADEMTKASFNPAPRIGGTRYATEKQISWIRSVASKISGYESADDIDKWVEEQLTLKPEQIPVFKVKDAVDKIESLGELEKSKPTIIQIDGESINLNDIPY